MDPWQIAGFLFLGLLQVIAGIVVYFISRQNQGERAQGYQRETIASLTEKHNSLRMEFDQQVRGADNTAQTLHNEQSKIKDQLSGLAGQFAAFSAENRGQLSAINDRLAHRDDRLASSEAVLAQLANGMKDMGIQIATLYERSKTWGSGSSQENNGSNRVLTDAERRVVNLLRQVVRDEG